MRVDLDEVEKNVNLRLGWATIEQHDFESMIHELRLLRQLREALKATRIHTPEQTTENEWIAAATCAKVEKK